MSTVTDAERSSRPRIAARFAASLADALNGLTGGGFEAEAAESGDQTGPEEPIVWKQPFSLADGAAAWLVAGKDLWEAAGEMILGGPGMDAVAEEDCRSTWNEIAAQAMGAVAQALTLDLGREILAQSGGVDSAGPADPARTAFVEVRNGQQLWRVQIGWTAQFSQNAAASAAPAAAEPVAVSPRRETVASKTLDLLLDVALPVSVSFGKTSLQIREVIKLSTGSVIELDRLVSEPVEVIVNNCVIARGEVVVVDGNYGVRIIHLASREDRLKSGIGEASSRLGLAAK